MNPKRELVAGCQVIKFATNPESQPALGLIQTNHSMPVSPQDDRHAHTFSKLMITAIG